MKKRNIIIIIALLVAAVIAALLLIRPGSKQAEPTSAVSSASAESLPEPGTVIIDKDSGITATVGVAESDAECEEIDEEPSGTPAPTPTPSPVPFPEEPAKSSYELFLALSSEQRDEFLNSFESYEAFYEWLIAAQAEYAALHPEIEIEPGGVIDLSKLGK